MEVEGLHLASLFRRDPAEDVHHLDDVVRPGGHLDIGRDVAVRVWSVRPEVEPLEGDDRYGCGPDWNRRCGRRPRDSEMQRCGREMLDCRESRLA